MNNNKREVRVFISSTFNDLHSERNFLNNIVFPKVRSYCNENGLQFIPVDLRWGISKQEEKNGKVLERCLSEIDESRPYFIGILGQRYGWVPSEEDQARINISNENKYAYALEQLKQKKSITHLEILHGVLNSPDMYDNSFFLFKNPSAVASVPVDLQEQLTEKEQLYSDKLTALKQKIFNGLPSGQISEYDCTFNGLKCDWKQTPEIKLESSCKDKVIEICGSDKTKKISIEQYEEQTDTIKNVLSKYIEFLPASEMYELASHDLLESMEKIWALSAEEYDSLEHLLEDNHIDIEEFETLSYKQKQLVHHFGYVDFKGLEEVGEWLTESLIAEIKKDRLEGVHSEELTGSELERSKHKSFQIEKLDAFVERPAVTKDLEQYLDGENDKPLLFTGKPGSGKSSMMAYLASKIEEKEDVDLCLRFIGATKKSNNITSLLVSIIEELEERYELERPAEYTIGSRRNDSDGIQISFSEVNNEDKTSIDQEPHKLFKYFEYILRAVGRKTKLVLILDAINQLSERDDAYHLSWLPYTCSENIRIICSSLPRKEDTEEVLSQNSIYESAERRELEVLSISPLEAEEKKGIVTNILVEKYGKKQEAFPLDILMQKQESNSPLYLYIASEELRTFFHFNEITAFTVNLPETTTGIIEHLLKRLELEFGEQLVCDSLSLIVTSMYGLSELELGDILSGMYGENYQSQKWLALYYNLRPYLKRGTGDKSLIDFMHGQFTEVVEKRYVSNKTEKTKYIRILGEYGSRVIQKEVSNKGFIPYNTTELALIYLFEIEDKDGIIDVIASIVFSDYTKYLPIIQRLIRFIINTKDNSLYKRFGSILKQMKEIYAIKLSMEFWKIADLTGSLNSSLKELIIRWIKAGTESVLEGNDFNVILYHDEISKHELTLIKCNLILGELHKSRGHLDIAEKLFASNVNLLESLIKKNRYSDRYSDELSLNYEQLAMICKEKAEYEKAKDYYSKCIDLREKLIARDPQNKRYELNLAAVYSLLGNVYKESKDYDEAHDIYEKSYNISKKMYNENNMDIDAKHRMAISLQALGNILGFKGKVAEALDKFQCSDRLYQEMYDDNPTNIDYVDSLAISSEKLGNYYFGMKDYDKALEYYRKDHMLSKRVYENDNSHEGAKVGYAIALLKYSFVNEELGKLAISQEQNLEAIILLEQCYQINPYSTDIKMKLSEAYKYLGCKYKKSDDYAEVLKYYEKSAMLGNIRCQFLTGLYYSRGKGVEKDYAKAIYWYEKSANQDYAFSQVNLGSAYELGKGVEQDYTKAIYWYEKAASKGQENGQYGLAEMYRQGKGVAQDAIKSAYWYEKSAKQGHMYSQFVIGHCYDFGEGVDQDYEKAFYWYEKSANQGHDQGQYSLACFYSSGCGVEQDYTKALYWYEKSANQGYSDAQFNLGIMYDNGKGVEQNYAKALYWYEKSANQGDQDAQFSVAEMYSKGLGVEKNKEEALKWFRKAEEQGHADAKNKIHELQES